MFNSASEINPTKTQRDRLKPCECYIVHQPANFEVMVSSYSSRTFSSLSLSRRSQIIPTCLRVNNGCSFLEGETPPEDAPGH